MADQLKATEHDRMWLGASDATSEGTWPRYTKWAPGQPDGGTRENCVEMWTTSEWNDAPCFDSKAFACIVANMPQRVGFGFPCTSGLVSQATLHGGVAPHQCTFRVFGADGVRPSAHKHEFASCTQFCEALDGGGRVAEPRTAPQRQFLGRILRESGDDSMWVGLETMMGRADANWRWRSAEALTADTSSWAHGQPDNDGLCVEMWGDTTWNDRGCGGDLYANKVCPCEVPMTVASLDDDGIERYN